MPDFDKSVFHAFTSDGHLHKMLDLILKYGDDAQGVKRVDEFLRSVESLGPLCKSTVEVEYLALMKRVINTTTESSLKGKFAPSLLLDHKLILYCRNSLG